MSFGMRASQGYLGKIAGSDRKVEDRSSGSCYVDDPLFLIRGTKAERIFRETKVLSIGGGAREIMKDLASRQLGW